VTVQVWVAVIAAVASLLVAIFSATVSRRSQRQLAELSHRLDEQRAERNARRDYEYDAKKRLYEECEPVLFEAMELAETFRRRVLSLARAARKQGINEDGTGWLAGNGYYFRSTAYYLLAPATTLKILQRRLTAVDLAVEPRIEFQYRLIKEIFDSYTWDHDLAEANPQIEYRPEEQGRRQGLYSGVVDQIADALTIESGDAYRCKSLGQFWAEFDDPQTAVGRLSGDIAGLLTGFHPASAPVLWRVLVCQYLICGALLRSRDLQQSQLPEPHEDLVRALNWHPDGAAVGMGDARATLLVARRHASRRLPDQRRT
jgi:hypothetical protein